MTAADIARLDVPLDVLTAQLRTTAAADLEAARLRLPLDDPDRHSLDLDVDRQFAEMAAKWGTA
ncbi:hypothetical protein [Streptomyces sp. DW26H14]|uniref:hypothetical protein n=1 Tax=Streptomyces sp. DW26H14 TaxID=3435395 RepID=UPI00403D86A0